MNTSEMLQIITPIIEQYAIYIAVFAFTFILTVIFLSRKKIKQNWLNFKIRRLLSRLGTKRLTNVQWPDGLDHYFTIDHLIMRHDGISIIMHKRFPGKIFCAEKIDEWTQMFGQKSYPFKNPLHELDYQINTLSESFPDISVNGYIFFDHLSEFPKGHPDRVFYYKETPEELKHDTQNNVKGNIVIAWEKILRTIN